MKFSKSKKERFVILEILEEKVTAANAPDLKTEFVLLQSGGYRNIICDLSSVSFVDSSGLSAFLVAHRICAADDGRFVLAEIPENVEKLMKLTQLDSIFTITASVNEAEKLILAEELERDLRK